MASRMFLYAALYAAVIGSITGAHPGVHDVCKKKNLQLETVGDSGFLTFDSSSIDNNHDYSCVLKIEACSSCQIELRPQSKDNFDFFCPSGSVTSRFCSSGCDYLYIFDMNYMNETMKYYKSWGQFRSSFKSESSNVFILLCHGFSKKYSFNIAYNTTRKLTKIQGLSESSSAFGVIQSPFFPFGYAQNHEVYEYHLNSTNPDDYIQLMFDDWHLSDTSVLTFENSNIQSQVTGLSNRPVVISNKNYLRVLFHTGVSLVAGENRDYLGFSASYRFYKSRGSIPQPKTYCKSDSYYMSSAGGKIDFTTSSPVRELYDCLWVLKKKDGFDGIFMKIVKFHSSGHSFDASYDHNTLVIRKGVSSIEPISEVVKMKQLQDSNFGVALFSDTGFYLRLNATMSSVTSLIISYASYKNSPGCGPTLYVCDNRRCIDRTLVCDGFDHCGDNSDEVAGCNDNNSHWDKSYQYTITIGVIVPMVISVFLIMVICLLFVMIRRCRRAQLNENVGSSERLRTVSEDVSEQHGERRRRRRRRGLFAQSERDRPPTYDEAMQNPPGWYQNVAFGNPVDPTLPQPPSYHEAVGGQNPEQTTTNQHITPGSPVSTDSSQSELTVCSGNLSDSSSSSDEGSTWGRYRGEGEGRRGRLGHHMSTSGSETYTTVEQSQSSIPSPEQNESVLVNASHDNVNASRDIVSSPDLELRNNNDNESGQKLRDNKILDKNLQKIQTSEPDDFVVPAGPKPGGSEILATHSRPRPIGPDVMLFRDQQDSSASAPRPAPRKSLDNRKNASQDSDVAMETRNKPNKKQKSQPPKGTDASAVNSAYARSDLSCQESDNADLYHDAYNDVEAGISKDYPSECRSNRRESSPSRVVAESNPAQHRSALDFIDANLQNRAVVNVDDDDIIIMYDSQSSINRAGISPPRYMFSQAEHPTEHRNVSYGRNPSSDGASRRRTDIDRENTYQVSQHYPSNERNFDGSVTSAGQRAGSSEQLSFTNRGGRRGSSEQLQSSHLSLNAELEDLEDVYV